MPSQKISEMPDAGTLDGSELSPVVRGDVNYRTTTAQISSFFLAGVSGGVLFSDGVGGVFTDPAIQYLGAGVIQLTSVKSFSYQATVPGGYLCDVSGNVFGLTIHAGNGFNGMGSFTNFEIVDGIVINAS